MFGYVVVYGFDGFCFHEGVYLDFDAAFARQMELNKPKVNDFNIYEDGYGEDYYPSSDKILAEAEYNEDWITYEKELEKHHITELSAICERINDLDEPPYNMYQLVEVEIIS